jgi:hypothetical protein
VLPNTHTAENIIDIPLSLHLSTTTLALVEILNRQSPKYTAEEIQGQLDSNNIRPSCNVPQRVAATVPIAAGMIKHCIRQRTHALPCFLPLTDSRQAGIHRQPKAYAAQPHPQLIGSIKIA